MNLIHRVLFVAWQNPATREIHPVARLVRHDAEVAWEFAYLRGAREAAASGFVPFPGLGTLDQLVKSRELPPLFANRLMPRSRADGPTFLARLGLAPEADEIPILARSEGRKATDTVELFGLPTFDEIRRCYRFLFFSRGLRYVPSAEQRAIGLQPGDRLDLRLDTENPADRLAIVVAEGDGQALGWVPSTLLEDVHRLQSVHSRIDVRVERVNNGEAPVQLRLLCRLEASHIEGYRPFSSERYEPIPSEAMRLEFRAQDLIG